MNIQETNDVLVHAQNVDNRQIGDSTVLEWHTYIADLDFALAVEAVRLHYRESSAWLMPAHVREGVERILLAGLGERTDEYGNVLEPDVSAVAAWRRVQSQRAVTA